MALKESLLQVISCMLSSNSDLQSVAEERKKALEVTEEYPVHLTEILLSSEEALEERQMAGILLKQYVKHYWQTMECWFDPPQVGDFVKQKIKTVLVIGLADPLLKIRNTISTILAQIMMYDYSHQNEEMLMKILLNLESQNLNACRGVLVFLRDFCYSYNCLQYCFAEKIYPVLFNICQDYEKYPTDIRAEVVILFANYVDQHNSHRSTKQELINIVTNFCEICQPQLVLPHPEKSDYILKSHIIKAYSILLVQMSQSLLPTIIKILPTIWEMLSHCGTMFDEMLVTETIPYRDPGEDLENPPRFYMLLYNLFEFLDIVVNVQQNVVQIICVLPDLLYYTILFMAIPCESEVLWKSDEKLYFAEEYEEICSETSVRIKAKDFLVKMAYQISPSNFINPLSQSVTKHLMLCKTKSESYYWRIMECVMFSIGALCNRITNLCYFKELLNFDITAYLTQWAEEIGPCPSWLMLARIMWVGGQYAPFLRSNSISIYIMTIIHNLREPSYILRYSAIRSLYYHLEQINKSDCLSVYMEMRNCIAYALIDALEHSSEGILQIGLFAMDKLLQLHPSITATIQNELVTLMINMFLKHLNNFDILTNYQTMVKHLCTSTNCHEIIETRFLPMIISIINQTIHVENSRTISFQDKKNAIETLNTIIKYSSESLSCNLIQDAFYSVYSCIITENDSAITQCGTDCLRSLLCKATPQIIHFTDNEGRQGADYILNILEYVLDPQEKQLASKQVGRFFITALHTLNSHMVQHIPSLLRNVLSLMQRAESVKTENSLLIIFAYLFYYHLESVLKYLMLFPGPDGSSALKFILRRWLCGAYSSDNKYQHNLNILAFSRLMEHIMSNRNEDILEMKIHIPFNNEKSTHAKEYIPVLALILKYLSYALKHELETCDTTPNAMMLTCQDTNGLNKQNLTATVLKTTTALGASLHINELDDDDNESYDEDIDDDNNESSSIYNCSFNERLDPLNMFDHIYNLEVSKYITNFLKSYATNENFSNCIHYLNTSEKVLLNRLGLDICNDNIRD